MHKCALCMCVLWLGLSQQQQGGDVVVVVGGWWEGRVSQPRLDTSCPWTDCWLASLTFLLSLCASLSLFLFKHTFLTHFVLFLFLFSSLATGFIFLLTVCAWIPFSFFPLFPPILLLSFSPSYIKLALYTLQKHIYCRFFGGGSVAGTYLCVLFGIFFPHIHTYSKISEKVKHRILCNCVKTQK